MDWHIRKLDGQFVLFQKATLFRTPMDTPFASRHLSIVKEAMADIRRFGTDPAGQVSMFSLQSSYLDFGQSVTRSEIVQALLIGLENDVFLARPTPPVLARHQAACFGPIAFDQAAHRTKLGHFRLRQLISVVISSSHLGSGILGTRLICGHTDRALLALGLCAWHSRHLLGTEGESSSREPADRLFEPPDPDEEFCGQICCSDIPTRFAEFTSRCRVVELIDKVRRFADFTEE